MILGFSIIAFFAAISVYYYIRAENLNRQLLIAKKEAKIAKKESKDTQDAMALIAKKNEELVLSKFKKLQDENSGDELLDLFVPLFNNYALIYREAVKGKGRLHKVVKKSCDAYKKGSYKQLTTFIGKQDTAISRAWASNNIGGFITFMDAMVLVLNKRFSANAAA